MDSGNAIVYIILLVGAVWGFWQGWKQLTRGTGILGGHLPEKALMWINQKQAPSRVVKVSVALICAYIFAFFTLAAVIIGFAWSIVHAGER